jgi:hypothetical protein
MGAFNSAQGSAMWFVAADVDRKRSLTGESQSHDLYAGAGSRYAPSLGLEIGFRSMRGAAEQSMLRYTAPAESLGTGSRCELTWRIYASSPAIAVPLSPILSSESWTEADG